LAGAAVTCDVCGLMPFREPPNVLSVASVMLLNLFVVVAGAHAEMAAWLTDMEPNVAGVENHMLHTQRAVVM
jgi:hypothetical protein